MQIRIANRQDEAPVRGLLETAGHRLDLAAAGADHDLHNLDQNYFGHDGIFLVAEIDGSVVAFAGARCEGDDKSKMILRRMFFASTVGGAEQNMLSEKFLGIIKNHAYQLDCTVVETDGALLKREV
jgi:hypothetical protein